MYSCEKPNNGIWTVYYETSCKQEWSIRESDGQTKKNLESYLSSKGIEPFRIKIEGKEQRTYCLSCDCLTGRSMEVLIDASDLEAIKAEGFSER